MVTYALAPNSSSSTYTAGIPCVEPARPNCDTVGKIHHFHREQIECLDDKTVNVEDLPKVDKCCRCGFEQDIQKPQIISKPAGRMVRNPSLMYKQEQSIFEDLRNEEKGEAEAILKRYNERRQKRIQHDALKFAKK